MLALETPQKILFLLEGRSVPASRVRVLQYQEYLRQEGIPFTNLFSFPNKYLWYPAWLKLRPAQIALGAVETAVVALVRCIQILCYVPRYEIVFLQRDLLFRVPSDWLERFLVWCMKLGGKKRRLIFDIDDAIYLDGHSHEEGPTSEKIGQILRSCDEVIAGNRTLAAFAARYSSVITIPSTVIMPPLRGRAERSPPTIGWIGVAGNLSYLSFLEPVLVELRRRFAFRVLLISNSRISPFSKDVPVEFLQWSEEEEARLLSLLDIGIMPLPDTQWTRGKCGYKLLQYMSYGIPSIASPVGVNQEIIVHARNGLVASTTEEWRIALESLLTSPELRARLGDAGRTTAETGYTRDRWYPLWRDAILGKLPA